MSYIRYMIFVACTMTCSIHGFQEPYPLQIITPHIQEILSVCGYRAKPYKERIVENKEIRAWINDHNLRTLFTPENVALHKDGPLMRMPLKTWITLHTTARKYKQWYTLGGAIWGFVLSGIDTINGTVYERLRRTGKITTYPQFIAVGSVSVLIVSFLCSRICGALYDMPAELKTAIGNDHVLVRLNGLKTLLDKAIRNKEHIFCQDNKNGFIVAEELAQESL